MEKTASRARATGIRMGIRMLVNRRNINDQKKRRAMLNPPSYERVSGKQ
jgi:hypothetical protein